MSNQHRPKTITPPDLNSVFSKAMNSRVAQVDRRPDGQIAALIVFRKEITTADVNDAIREMGTMVESYDTLEFKPEYGMPVIFFP